ncbi:MAG: winged helix-turn-helix transcriptional regulator [Nevskiaceae bacterium]
MRKKGRKPPEPRSSCPIAWTLDFIGDKWTLVVLRDLILGRKRYFQEFLDSGEGVASNILASRLRQLEVAGMVTREADPEQARRVIYTPTGKALDLLPVMLEIVRWGDKYFAGSGAPPALLRGIERDRDAVIAGLRSANASPRTRVRGRS